MKKANLIFKDNTPFSLDFDDFYFNSKDGLNESKFVYSEAFEFEENDTFIIAESGFGIGLNFFLTLKRFLQAKKRPKKLFYTSIEGFYIEKDKLREIYQKLGFYEEFKEILEAFLKFYP
ncbi:bifunctional tRNA (5-methylaminomethyl-2-thiouridine)(34)-methyltransferase MnmD/FAD-dependent 5-carboxymethylaminomethyl-2-thiouridine(34) oxidoreductase MnmC, partial [Campylobacter coli]|nr:bifunctional tRNA (5-methylaminomethyl-2-thiouridine)(34)-methyltransferase MnmD/FAD-dependent 5-carboxymethylaminomethyl-2-thiouridine(34) oxidoreductase MnmC [Campylobacter coli]